MSVEEVIAELKKHTNKKNQEGMARFGINVSKAFGISIPVIRSLAKKIGKDHKLTIDLWKTEYHEARILCSMIAEPDKVTPALMDRWAKDFNSWDICDQCCNNLFVYTPHVQTKIIDWNDSPNEFVKRASFVLMAVSAVHVKEWDNGIFESFFLLIEKHSTDERNFVKKAVNWALRQIGKRNVWLNRKASSFCLKIAQKDSKGAKWIASDALKELTNKKIQVRLKS